MFTLVIASGAIMLGCVAASYVSKADMQADEIVYHDQWSFEW